MIKLELKRKINVPDRSSLTAKDYQDFLVRAFELIAQSPHYLTPDDDVNVLELAHLIPEIPETIIAIYVGINDAVCNKGLVSPFLVRHGHNNVFAFDPAVYPGGNLVPTGTADAKKLLAGFEPPNPTWPADWSYVMIEDPTRTIESLWREKGYIDMIPAKFEDFTMLSDPAAAAVCTFIDPRAFDHPVNKARPYLTAARDRGQKLAHTFKIPAGLEGETASLTPVILNKGEKLYVATTTFGPCAHAWSNLRPANTQLAVINENSAVPLDLVIAKPPANPKFAKSLIPPKGSADLTTDWFYRGSKIARAPLLQGLFKG